jgi:proteasome assembly chaperone (PAC2) family protein
MSETLELNEIPQAAESYLFVGWRQWADGGSVSSGLPHYLVEQTGARPIGRLCNDDFYLFQIPGTHDLLRPVVQFEHGFPKELETPKNEFFFSGDEKRGLAFFIGDEPHLNVERYIEAILEAARRLKVRRIIGFGGVYGEVPFNKERTISSNYSLETLKTEIEALGVNLSEYQGGASIGSVLCKRAGEAGIEYVSFYAFVPAYDFSRLGEHGGSLRIENDFGAWLGVMKRVKTMLNLELDLYQLEVKYAQLVEAFEEKMQEIDKANPEMHLPEYLKRLGEDFEEVSFNPSDEFWEEKLSGLFDDLEGDNATHD